MNVFVKSRESEITEKGFNTVTDIESSRQTG